MELTQTSGLGSGCRCGRGCGAAPPRSRPMASTEDLTAEAIKAFTGGAEMAEGGVEIGAPEIAENGNTVPVEVSAEGATAAIMLLSR